MSGWDGLGVALAALLLVYLAAAMLKPEWFE